MKAFAWLTFLTGLTLSGIAAFFSVFGLALIYAGAFWPVVALASTLEVAKLVAVSWMYRYRHLAGRGVRVYFYTATLTLMLITSLGIFGFLTRAHVETEGTAATAELTLQEVQQRESQLKDERDQINTELKVLNEQSSQLVTQLGAAQRLRGTSGAVNVQRENAARRTALLAELKRINADLTTVQKERITTETETNKATADIGPLRYVAQAVYGSDDLTTIRSAVVWLTAILMIVFDPMAVMLLIAANILFTHQSPRLPIASAIPEPTPSDSVAESLSEREPELENSLDPLPEPITPQSLPLVPMAAIDTDRATDVPKSLHRSSDDEWATNLYLNSEAKKIIKSDK